MSWMRKRGMSCGCFPHTGPSHSLNRPRHRRGLSLIRGCAAIQSENHLCLQSPICVSMQWRGALQLLAAPPEFALIVFDNQRRASFFAHHLWAAPALQCFNQPFVSGLSAAFKSFLECAFRLSANLKATSRLELSSITEQRSSDLKSVMTLLARDSLPCVKIMIVREDNDCACGKESVSRSAGLARGTMPPPSRIAESRDVHVSRKTGFMRKIGKLPGRAISTLRPSRTQYNAVATLHVSEVCPSVSASSIDYVCLMGARAAGVFLSRMTAGFVSVEYASAWCLFPAS